MQDLTSYIRSVRSRHQDREDQPKEQEGEEEQAEEGSRYLEEEGRRARQEEVNGLYRFAFSWATASLCCGVWAGAQGIWRVGSVEPQERWTITWMGRRACGVGLYPQLAYSLAKGYGSYRVDNNIQLFSSVHPAQYHANGDALYHGYVSRHVSNAIDGHQVIFRLPDVHPNRLPGTHELALHRQE